MIKTEIIEKLSEIELAEAKEWAKKEGLTLSAYVNRAVKNQNLACHIQEDMKKELSSMEEVLLKYSEKQND